MSTAGRLAKLERSLTPTQAALLWFENANRFGSLDAYARFWVEQADPAADLERMIDQVSSSVSEALKGREPREIIRATDVALGDVRLLYHMILVLNQAPRKASLLADAGFVALVGEMRRYLNDPLSTDVEARRADPEGTSLTDGGWRSWRQRTEELVSVLRVEQRAHILVYERYFGGRAVLFADAAEASTRFVEVADWLARIVKLLPEPYRTRARPQRKPRAAAESRSIEDRAVSRAKDLIDEGRIAAYIGLGDRGRALAIAEGQLRRWLASEASPR